MRWPWQRREKRESGGNFTDAVLRLIESQAAGTAADAGSTAAVEAASGALSRAFAAAKVEGPEWVQAAVSPNFLSLVGRDLIRRGQSLHVIRMTESGVKLIPSSSWHWEGSDSDDTWTVRATTYGPSTSTTRVLPRGGVCFVLWGAASGQPYTGVGPLAWARTTARMQAETERSLADESAGPIAQLLAIPSDGGDGGDEDPLKMLKADLKSARGKALLMETTAAGWGEGASAAPRRDWMASRLGPQPPAAMSEVWQHSFDAVLAACGTPPSLFRAGADGTAQREALRRWHMGTVLPLARLLESELTERLETPVALKFDSYPKDMISRAQVFSKLIAAEGVDPVKAMEIAGLLED